MISVIKMYYKTKKLKQDVSLIRIDFIINTDKITKFPEMIVWDI